MEFRHQPVCRSGETLWAAYRGDRLAAIGGLTIEAAMPGAFRMRRFYVAPADRRCGIARRLAQALLETLPPGCAAVTVNAAAGSESFWEALGFVQVPSATWTHLRIQT